LALCRLGLPGAWLAAAIFALHPVHVESVAWITERKNTLSGVLYLASALCFLRYSFGREGLRREISERRRPWLAALAVVLFVCALLAKTVTATLPLTLALVLVWKAGTPRRDQMLWLGAMLAAGAAMGFLTLYLETHSVGAQGAEFSMSVAERFIVAGRALWFYLGKLVWPLPLAFSYARWNVDAGAAWQYLFSLSAAGTLASLWWLRVRIGHGPWVAAAFFAVTLSPALGIFNVFYMRYAFVADHFQYLASIGPITLLATAWSRLPLPRPAARTAAAVLLVTLGLLTWNQAGAYRDQETLWRHSLAAEPESFMAHYNLGELLERNGQWDEAMTHYRETLRLNPTWADAWVNLGSVHGKRGEIDDALRCFDRAIEIAPGHATAYFDRGVALEMQGRPDRALEAYAEAVRLQPQMVQAHHNLALLHFDNGDFDRVWREVHLVRRHGGAMSPSFLRQLSVRLADPTRGAGVNPSN
jgi:tetratricopeptide (TPR) repeat protein